LGWAIFSTCSDDRVTPPSQKEAPAVEPGSIDELVRVIALALRYQGAPQGTMVHDLSKLGLAPARIAELLGTTANTVSQQKRKARPAWPPKSSSGEAQR
jgi:hypothetical protein